jgi:hypothetical protein
MTHQNFVAYFFRDGELVNMEERYTVIHIALEKNLYIHFIEHGKEDG